MMGLLADIFTVAAILAGLGFFAAGTLGLVRLPDTLTRIHAVAKADNVGLGLIVIGLLPHAHSLLAAAKMIAVWLLAQLASGAIAQVMAEEAIPHDDAPEAPAPEAPAPGERAS